MYPEGEIRPSQIEFSETFSQTWTAFTDQLGICILVGLIFVVINIALSQAANVGGIAVGIAVHDEVIGNVANFAFSMIGQLPLIWIGIGVGIFYLKVVRGQEASVGDIFTGGPYYLRILGGSIIIGVICSLLLLVILFACGVLATIVGHLGPPGVIWQLSILAGLALWLAAIAVVITMFYQYFYLIIDRNMGIFEAFGVSRNIMSGNKGILFVILLVANFLGVLFTLCTCLTGSIAYIPFMGLLYAVVYLMATGQPTMSDLRNMPYQQQTQPYPQQSPFQDPSQQPDQQ